MQRLLRKSKNKINEIYYALRNRFFTKPYIIKVDGINRYRWTDRDEVIFHATFQVLVDFIEKEIAPNGYYQVHEKGMPFRGLNKAEKKFYALKYFEWEINLENTTDDDKDLLNALKEQAETGKQLRDLYLWYTEIYPQKLNAIEQQQNISHMGYEFYKKIWSNRKLTDEEDKKYEDVRNKWRTLHNMEEALEQEKTDKACELLKIRRVMWT